MPTIHQLTIPRLLGCKRTTLFAGLLLATLIQLPAYAETHAGIKHKNITATAFAGHDEVEISSSDGTNWDTIEATPLKFAVNFEIDTYWPGVVEHFSLHLGRLRRSVLCGYAPTGLEVCNGA